VKRRDFVALISAAAAWPVAPHAQQAGVHRIGLVFATCTRHARVSRRAHLGALSFIRMVCNATQICGGVNKCLAGLLQGNR
jgi:hypothetical protein